jgi:hypothetical protein
MLNPYLKVHFNLKASKCEVARNSGTGKVKYLLKINNLAKHQALADCEKKGGFGKRGCEIP